MTVTGAVYTPPEMSVYVSSLIIGPTPTWAPESLDDEWLPTKANWGSNGKMSTLTMERNLGIGPDKGARGHIEGNFAQQGDRVSLVDGASGRWFNGHVGKISRLMQADPDAEIYVATVYGPELLLANKVISGRWFATKLIDDEEMAGTAVTGDRIYSNSVIVQMPCVLNPGGQPNASESLWALRSDAVGTDTKESAVFFPTGRLAVGSVGQAEHWTAYVALKSIVELFDDGDVISDETTDWVNIKALLFAATTVDPILPEVNLEGKNLLEAIAAILLPIGFGFNLEPWSVADTDTELRHRLRVYSLSDPAWTEEPILATFGSNIGDVATAEVIRLDTNEDSTGIRNDIKVIGDVQRMACIVLWDDAIDDHDLLHGWDVSTYPISTYQNSDSKSNPADWSVANRTTFEARYLPTSKEFLKYSEVWRKFALDTDGSLWDNLAQTSDLSGLDSDFNDHVNRIRTFGPTWSVDGAGDAARWRPAYVTMEIDGEPTSAIGIPQVVFDRNRTSFKIMYPNIHTWQPFKQFHPSHGSGITFTSAAKTIEIANMFYLDLIQNTLDGSGHRFIFKLYTSIETDNFVVGHRTRTVSQKWPLTAQKIIRQPNRFKLRDQTADFSGGDTVDDSAAALVFANQVGESIEDADGNTAIVLRELDKSYHPGIGIPRTSTRVIELTVDGVTAAVAPIINGVVWNFSEGVNTTELSLDSNTVRM